MASRYCERALVNTSNIGRARKIWKLIVGGSYELNAYEKNVRRLADGDKTTFVTSYPQVQSVGSKQEDMYRRDVRGTSP